eukprot:9313017-Karenia_brevis.AAC.1
MPTPAAGAAYSLWGLVLNFAEDGVAGKTGIYEASILLDTEIWLDPIWRMLTVGKDPESSLWQFSAESL